MKQQGKNRTHPRHIAVHAVMVISSVVVPLLLAGGLLLVGVLGARLPWGGAAPAAWQISAANWAVMLSLGWLLLATLWGALVLASTFLSRLLGASADPASG